MKAAILKAPEQIEIEETVTPKPGQDEILIRVRAVGICGSEIHAYDGLHPRRQPPVVLGHEFAGDIVAVGPQVKAYQLEDRVTVMPQNACGKCDPCRHGWTNMCDFKKLLGSTSWPGAFAEFVVASQDTAYRLEPSLNYIHGALVEPLAVGVHAVRQGKVKLGDRVAVLGAGPIGILSMLCAREAGATELIAADLYDFNLAAARRFGADCIVNSTTEALVSKVTAQYGQNAVDVAIIAAGAPALLDQAFEIVRKKGSIVLVAIFNHPVNIDIEKSRLKEQDIIASSTYLHQDYLSALGLLLSKSKKIESIVTHRVPFERIDDTIRMVKHRTEDVIKAIIEY